MSVFKWADLRLVFSIGFCSSLNSVVCTSLFVNALPGQRERSGWCGGGGLFLFLFVCLFFLQNMYWIGCDNENPQFAESVGQQVLGCHGDIVFLYSLKLTNDKVVWYGFHY